MIKIVFCLPRKPGLSFEAFDSYWRDQHAPLVASFKDTLRIRRYIQSPRVASDQADIAARVRGAPEPYDGVAELWFDSWDDLTAGFDTDAGRKAGQTLIDDESKFIDFSRSPIFFVEERTVIE